MNRNSLETAVFLVFAAALCASAQDSASPQTGPEPNPDAPVVAGSPVPVVPLRVPKGLPLQVALDKEVRVHEAGQAIHGKTMQPVYAFDRVVIPVGTEVLGRVAKVEELSTKQRTLSALDADFTPNHKLELEFNELVLPDGKHLPVRTVVTRGSGQVIEFVRAKGEEGKGGVKSAASEKIDQARTEAQHAWDEAKREVQEPGRMHRLEHYLVEQLPIHPQYLDAGTLYSAELEEPLEFGTTPLTPQLAVSLTRQTPTGSLVHATLLTPLSSATAQRDDRVEAILWQPLFDEQGLILPAGTRLKGSVIEVHPAHKLHHNGQLRVAFHDVETPDGLDQKVSAVMVGVAAAKADHVVLDTEGGAQATAPNTRYLSTALALGLAANSVLDNDTLNRGSGGTAGYKLLGLAMTATVRSQPLGMALGAVGAGRSIYGNFLGRGHEIIFPKDTPMEFSLSPEHPAPAGPHSGPATESR